VNTFGRIFKVSIFGESHGKAVGVLVDGCPAGIELNEKDFSDDLKRRKGGGYGKTERIEEDRPIILSGVFNGRTTGAPIMVIFENKNVRPADYEALKNLPRPGRLSRRRPLFRQADRWACGSGCNCQKGHYSFEV